MAIPERNGPNSERQGPHTNKIIQVGQRNEDAAAINDAFPVPKIVNCEIIGRHPNKSAFVLAYDSPDYQAKSEIVIVAGALGAVQTEVTPDGKPVEYGGSNKADAASLVLSEATDDTDIVSLVGDLNYRSSIKAKADSIKLHAREVLELSAGGENYLSNTKQAPIKSGAVHIVAGNRVDNGDYSLQPLVKGDNLKEYLDEISETIANLNSNQQKIIESIITLQTILTPIVSSLSFTIPALFPLSVVLAGDVVKTALSLTNNLGTGVNNELKKINYNRPYAPKNILSKFNKVN